MTKITNTIKEALSKLYSNPLLILSAVEAYGKWIIMGCPTRSQEEVYDIFHNKCGSCEHFNRFYENEGECNMCGCYLKDRKNLLELNKIQFKTEKCPDGQWR